MYAHAVLSGIGVIPVLRVELPWQTILIWSLGVAW